MNFKNFFIESEHFFFKYKHYKILDTDHSIDRKIQRKDDIVTYDDFKKIFMKIIDKILSDLKYFESASHYLFYSKSYNQGIVMEFIPERKVLKVITVLKRYHQIPKKGTKKIFVENINNFINESQIISKDKDVLQYIINLIPEDIFNSTDKQYDFEKVKLENYLELYFSNGKLYDLNAEVIIID